MAPAQEGNALKRRQLSTQRYGKTRQGLLLSDNMEDTEQRLARAPSVKTSWVGEGGSENRHLRLSSWIRTPEGHPERPGAVGGETGQMHG